MPIELVADKLVRGQRLTASERESFNAFVRAAETTIARDRATDTGGASRSGTYRRLVVDGDLYVPAGVIKVGPDTKGNVGINSGGIKLNFGTTNKIWLQTDGDVLIGDDTSAAGKTYISIFSTAQTYNGESVSAGDMLIGDNSASKANIFWDKSAGQLLFRGGTSTTTTIDTNGLINFINGLNLRWYDSAGNANVGQLGYASTDNFVIFNTKPGKSIVFSITMNDESSEHFDFDEDPAQVNRTQFTINGGVQGAKFVITDPTSLADTTIQTAGSSGGSTFANFPGAVNVGTGSSTTAGVLTVSGRIFVNDTSDANVTIGLTINQGANDDYLLTFKSSDVAHGMTSDVETDTYAAYTKASAAAGGLLLQGWTEDEIGFYLIGNYTNDDTGKATTADAGFILRAAKKSGTSTGAPGANANLVAIKSETNTRFIFDAEGDSHEDGTGWTAYDDYDDIGLLNALDFSLGMKHDPLRAATGAWLAENKAMLAAARIVTFNDDIDGVPFINKSRLSMLLVGAVRQLAARLDKLERRYALS